MNQQMQPMVKYIKSNDFDALVEEYYHPTEKDANGQPVFLNKRVIISRDEWVSRKEQTEAEFKKRMEFFDHIFKILDEKKEEPKKGKKK